MEPDIFLVKYLLAQETISPRALEAREHAKRMTVGLR